jgi:hypothetical protein
MKGAPSGLISLLQTGSFVFCDLYQFTLTTGQVLRYTTSDMDISGGFASSGLEAPYNKFNDPSFGRTNCTITASAGLSPDGTNDAWSWQRSSTAKAYIGQNLTRPPTVDTYRYSLYAKAGTGNFLAMYMSSAPGDPFAVRATFDLSNGTFGSLTFGSLTNAAASITPAGNGWYLCSLQATLPADGLVRPFFSGNANGSQVDSTDSLSNTTILVFGGTVDILNIYSSALFFDQLGTKASGHWKTGLDTDTWQVYVMPVDVDPVTGASFPVKIGNTSWLAAVAAGALAGATVDIHRAYWASWPQPWTSPLPIFSDISGTYVITDYFAGRVAAVDCMRNQAVISVNSWLDQFKLLMPRNFWQSLCRWTLFDAGCALSQASFAVNGTAQAGSTQSLIATTGLGKPLGYFSLGQVRMTSGLNSGFGRMVKLFDSSMNMQLIAPFPFALSPGDTFTAYPGCDKTLTTCTNTFANAVNFGGEDLIPVPETAA